MNNIASILVRDMWMNSCEVLLTRYYLTLSSQFFSCADVRETCKLGCTLRAHARKISATLFAQDNELTCVHKLSKTLFAQDTWTCVKAPLTIKPAMKTSLCFYLPVQNIAKCRANSGKLVLTRTINDQTPCAGVCSNKRCSLEICCLCKIVSRAGVCIYFLVCTR